MSDTTEFCVFDLPVVYVYGSFPFDLDAIGIVLVHISSTSGSKWPPGGGAEGELRFQLVFFYGLSVALGFVKRKHYVTFQNHAHHFPSLLPKRAHFAQYCVIMGVVGIQDLLKFKKTPGRVENLQN